MATLETPALFNSPITNSKSRSSILSRSCSTTPVMIGSKPSLISVRGTSSNANEMRFLIMDAPRQANLHLYIKECRKHHVTDVIRVCEPTYSAVGLESAGIMLHEMPYPDGHSPPKEVLDRWLTLVDQRFFQRVTPDAIQNRTERINENGTGTATPGNVNGANPTEASSLHESSTSFSNMGSQTNRPSISNLSTFTPTIAVHCVAGLGRAPVLVAIALIEFADMDPVEAVRLIRRYRRGAINEKQLNWLEQYRRSFKRGVGGNACCIIS